MNANAAGDYRGEGRIAQHMTFMENINKLTFEPEDIVLDVGCGTGEETKFIASKVAWITGFDISEKMITEARKNNSGPNITYNVWDVRSCGENPDWRERFDKAFSNYVLHWVSERSEALKNILACLKPGGEALFVICNRAIDITEMTQYIRSHSKWGAFVKDYEPPYCQYNLSQSEFEELFSTSGWTDVRVELKQQRTSLNAAQTKLYFKTCMDLINLIPEEYWEECLEDVVREAQSRYSDPAQADNFKIPGEYAVVVATKPRNL